MKKLTKPGSIIELNTYTDDGLLSVHALKNDTPGGVEDRFPQTWIDSTGMTYDVRGNMLTSKNKFGAKDTITYTYSGLGALRTNVYSAYGVNIANRALNATVSETYSSDAMRNSHSIVESFTVSVDGGPMVGGPGQYTSSTSDRTPVYAVNTGRMTAQTRVGSVHAFRYDSAGNTVLSSIATIPSNWAVQYDDRVAYYDAAGVVRESERRVHDRLGGSLVWEQAYLTRMREWYRYDPLGRRILVRAKTSCWSPSDQYYAGCDIGWTRRTVWNGSAELVEIQRPVEGLLSGTLAMQESDISTLSLPMRTQFPIHYGAHLDPNRFFGRVAYTHAGGVDRPLSITRFAHADRDRNATGTPLHYWPTFTLIPHWNARGEATTGTYANGAGISDTSVSGDPRELGVEWPVGALAFGRLVSDTVLTAWHGTLIHQKQDLVGTLYRRNRNYDASVGRFTQEDPIGLAGGLNLYGSAGGDPINFSDPFGLCPKDMGGDGKSRMLSDCPEGSEGHKRHAEQTASASASDATRLADSEAQNEAVARAECIATTTISAVGAGAATGRLVGAVTGGAVQGLRGLRVSMVVGGASFYTSHWSCNLYS